MAAPAAPRTGEVELRTEADVAGRSSTGAGTVFCDVVTDDGSLWRAWLLGDAADGWLLVRWQQVCADDPTAHEDDGTADPLQVAVRARTVRPRSTCVPPPTIEPGLFGLVSCKVCPPSRV
jgi:hypothetical protein